MLNRLRKYYHKISNDRIEQDLRPELNKMSEKIDKLHHLLIEQQYIMDPEILGDESLMQEVLSEQYTNLSLKPGFHLIHKNDLMYRYIFFREMDRRRAIKYYYESGLDIAQSVRSLLPEDFNVGKWMDMASGHGRVTRFLPFLAEEVTVSEVKTDATEFQQKTFGYKAYKSTFEPAEFNPPDAYDLITVISMFSHLNEELFKAWLYKLIEFMEPNGILLFSTHGMELLSSDSGQSFHYKEISEDHLFHYVDGSIKKKQVYGTAYVTEDFIRDLLSEKNVEVSFYPRYISNLQDCYVVRLKT